MNLIILIFVLSFGVFYIGICIKLLLGINTLSIGKSNACPSVSVIISARNEEINIEQCLDACLNQTYPKDKYEVIVINDRSEDRTGEIIQRMMKKSSNLKCIDITEQHPQMAPKKYALQQGITKASGEIILTTDADCRPQSEWLHSMIACFEEEVALVAGYSPLTANASSSLLHTFIGLEALGLAGVMAGSFGAGFPLTCSGRNLAYRKSVFQEIGGFKDIEHFVSGDDDLFLHLISQKTDYQVKFAIDPASVVPSKPAQSIREFSNQRTRHASKGLHYHWDLKIGLIAVYLFYLSLLSSLGFPSIYLWALLAFGLKSGLEFTLMFRTARLFSQVRLLKFFPIVMWIHVPYVVIFGLWGQFGKFKWKDTRFSKKVNRN
ncbi:glycosyltransferase [bacterium]